MSPGYYYHIYKKGISRKSLFFEGENFLVFLKQFRKYLSDYVDVFSYCSMPGHFYFFIRVKKDVPAHKIKGKLTVAGKHMKVVLFQMLKT